MSFISYASLPALDFEVSEENVSSILKFEKYGSQPLSPPIILSGKIPGSPPTQSNHVLTQIRLPSKPAWTSFLQYVPPKHLFQPTTLYDVKSIQVYNKSVHPEKSPPRKFKIYSERYSSFIIIENMSIYINYALPENNSLNSFYRELAYIFWSQSQKYK
jgi:hypothetical protein